MINLKSIYKSYFPNGTCKFDPILSFILDILNITGWNWITMPFKEQSLLKKSYAVFNMSHIFIILSASINGIRIGENADLKLNALMFLLLCCMVSLYLK